MDPSSLFRGRLRKRNGEGVTRKGPLVVKHPSPPAPSPTSSPAASPTLPSSHEAHPHEVSTPPSPLLGSPYQRRGSAADPRGTPSIPNSPAASPKCSPVRGRDELGRLSPRTLGPRSRPRLTSSPHTMSPPSSPRLPHRHTPPSSPRVGHRPVSPPQRSAMKGRPRHASPPQAGEAAGSGIPRRVLPSSPTAAASPPAPSNVFPRGLSPGGGSGIPVMKNRGASPPSGTGRGSPSPGRDGGTRGPSRGRNSGTTWRSGSPPVPVLPRRVSPSVAPPDPRGSTSALSGRGASPNVGVGGASRGNSPNGSTVRGASPGSRCSSGSGGGVSEEVVRGRVRRAVRARLYLLHQPGPNSFSVGGDSPTHKYRVIIGPQSCSCGHGPHCVHVLFVMVRVLQVPEASPVLLAPTLKDYEAEQLLSAWEERRKKAVRAREDRLPQASHSSSTPSPASPSRGNKQGSSSSASSPSRRGAPSPDARRQDLSGGMGDDEESQCPICLTVMVEGESLVACEAGCRNLLHHHCMAVWAADRHCQMLPLLCPLCRTPWPPRSDPKLIGNPSPTRGGPMQDPDEGFSNPRESALNPNFNGDTQGPDGDTSGRGDVGSSQYCRPRGTSSGPPAEGSSHSCRAPLSSSPPERDTPLYGGGRDRTDPSPSRPHNGGVRGAPSSGGGTGAASGPHRGLQVLPEPVYTGYGCRSGTRYRGGNASHGNSGNASNNNANNNIACYNSSPNNNNNNNNSHRNISSHNRVSSNIPLPHQQQAASSSSGTYSSRPTLSARYLNQLHRPSAAGNENSVYRPSVAGNDAVYRPSAAGNDSIYRPSTSGNDSSYRPSTAAAADSIYRTSTTGNDGIYRTSTAGHDGIYRSSTAGNDSIYRLSVDGQPSKSVPVVRSAVALSPSRASRRGHTPALSASFSGSGNQRTSTGSHRRSPMLRSHSQSNTSNPTSPHSPVDSAYSSPLLPNMSNFSPTPSPRHRRNATPRRSPSFPRAPYSSLNSPTGGNAPPSSSNPYTSPQNNRHAHNPLVYNPIPNPLPGVSHTPLGMPPHVGRLVPGYYPPTLRGEVSAAMVANVGDDVVPLPRSEPIPVEHEESAAAWVAVFGRELVACLFSRDWAVRETGLRRLAHEVVKVLHWDQLVTGEDTKKKVVHCCANILAQVVNDPVYKVYLACLRVVRVMLSYLTLSVQGEVCWLQELLRPLLHTLLLKCADGNRRTSQISVDSLLELSRGQEGELALGRDQGGSLGLGGVQYVLSCILDEAPPQEAPWQWLLGRLCVLDRLLDQFPEQFQIQMVSLQPAESGYKLQHYDRLMTVVEFAFKALGSSHATVAKLARRVYICGARMAAAEPNVFRHVCDMLGKLDISLQMRLKRRLRSLQGQRPAGFGGRSSDQAVHKLRLPVNPDRRSSFSSALPRLVRSVSHSPSRLLSQTRSPSHSPARITQPPPPEPSPNPPPPPPPPPPPAQTGDAENNSQEIGQDQNNSEAEAATNGSQAVQRSNEQIENNQNDNQNEHANKNKNDDSTRDGVSDQSSSLSSVKQSPPRPTHLPLDSLHMKFKDKQARVRQYHRSRPRQEEPIIVQHALITPKSVKQQQQKLHATARARPVASGVSQRQAEGRVDASSVSAEVATSSGNEVSGNQNAAGSHCNDGNSSGPRGNEDNVATHHVNEGKPTTSHGSEGNIASSNGNNGGNATTSNGNDGNGSTNEEGAGNRSESKQAAEKKRNRSPLLRKGGLSQSHGNNLDLSPRTPTGPPLPNFTFKDAIASPSTPTAPFTTPVKEPTHPVLSAELQSHVDSLTNDGELLPLEGGLPKIPKLPLLPPYLAHDVAGSQERIAEETQDVYEERKDWVRGQLLGSGAFSCCYQARDIATGTLMAVKLVSFVRNSSEEQERVEAAVEEEILLMSQLRHRNIVRLIGSVRHATSFCMFTEWMPGGSVFSMLERYGAFSEPVILRYVKQVLLGLDYLHDNMILHRDLKGANLLIDSTGNWLRIGDFGTAARLASKSTVTGEFQGQLLGTLAFMAPEVLRGDDYGRACDIWSIGCCIIEMATTKPPWDADHVSNQYKLMFKIATSNGPPSVPPRLSDATRRLTLQCLQINSENRPSTKQLLRHSSFTGPPPEHSSCSTHS